MRLRDVAQPHGEERGNAARLEPWPHWKRTRKARTTMGALIL
jgi:hypothetical protein